MAVQPIVAAPVKRHYGITAALPLRHYITGITGITHYALRALRGITGITGTPYQLHNFPILRPGQTLAPCELPPLAATGQAIDLVAAWPSEVLTLSRTRGSGVERRASLDDLCARRLRRSKTIPGQILGRERLPSGRRRRPPSWRRDRRRPPAERSSGGPKQRGGAREGCTPVPRRRKTTWRVAIRQVSLRWSQAERNSPAS